MYEHPFGGSGRTRTRTTVTSSALSTGRTAPIGASMAEPSGLEPLPVLPDLRLPTGYLSPQSRFHWRMARDSNPYTFYGLTAFEAE